MWLGGPPVSVLSSNILPDAKTGCSVRQCTEGTSVSACQAFTFELFRSANNSPKSSLNGPHAPILTLNASEATILVGNGTVQNEDGAWSSHVFALDDLGNLVALCEMLPTEPTASCSFQVPAGAAFKHLSVVCYSGSFIFTVVFFKSSISSTRTSGKKNRINIRQEPSSFDPSNSTPSMVSMSVTRCKSL